MILIATEISDRFDLDISAKSATVDFELAIHNACKTVIDENIDINGCFMHLCNNILKTVQSQGHQTEYTDAENPSLRDFVTKVESLAFLPPAELDEGTQILRDEAPSHAANEILDYFVATYVTGTYRAVRQQNHQQQDGIRNIFRHQAPLYPREKWSVYQRTLDGVDRTNNSSEGWNRAYGEMVGHASPTIWKSIKTICMDEAKVHTMIIQHNAGRRIQPTNPPKKKYQALNERMQNLCRCYILGQTDISNYLKNVSYNVLQSRRK